MLEITIIICLAVALFLVLRHYPESKKERDLQDLSAPEKDSLWKHLQNLRRKKTESGIEEAIVKDQEEVVAPSEIERARIMYSENNPELAKKLYNADQALLANDLRQAEEMALEVVSVNKRSGEAYVILGKVASSRGQFDDAKEAFKVAIKCNHNLAEAYLGRGQIELKDEDYSKAIDDLSRAVMLDRSHPEWHAELGRAYLEVRQFAKAAKAFKKAASLDIENKEYKELASEAEDKHRAHSYVARLK